MGGWKGGGRYAKQRRNRKLSRYGVAYITTRRDLVAVADDSRHAVGAGVSLHTEFPQYLSDVVADPEDVYVALLLNLGRNASARLRDDSEVVILAKNGVPRAGVSTGAAEIIIADNGGGTVDEALWRMFDVNS